MSYGWLTESSLQPKPGKPVNVPSSSIFNLQAIVYQKRQEIKENRVAHALTVVKPTKKYMPRAARLMEGRNEGVNTRRQHDELHRIGHSDFTKSMRVLEEKAKLYEKLESCKRDDPMMKKSQMNGILVDFMNKPCLAPSKTEEGEGEGEHTGLMTSTAKCLNKKEEQHAMRSEEDNFGENNKRKELNARLTALREAKRQRLAVPVAASDHLVV